jgi:hypothetical protein
MRPKTRQGVRRYSVSIATVVVAVVLSIVPASASAVSPVLEFVTPGKAFPVALTTESGPVNAEMAGFSALVDCTASHGSGELTGPRSAVAEYTFTGCTTEQPSAKCKSEGASAEEIKTGPIAAELVYVDQAKHEVAMLLNPGGGIYMKFECGGELTEASGDFLAPGGPINQEATSFTLTLSQFDALQIPDEYETLSGERLQAVPMGKRGSHEPATTGVEATFTVHTAVPVEVRVITAAEVEAGQREEAQRKHDEETLRKREAEIKQEEALNRSRAEEAANERNAEEVAQRKREEAQSKHPTRTQLLTKALKQCKKEPEKKRTKCDAKAERKYGGKAKHGKGQKGR